MGLFTRKEFAQLCHTTTAIVTTNISRKKVIEDEINKKIDSEHPINKVFFDKYAKKAQQKVKKIPSSKEIDKLYKEAVSTLEKKAAVEVKTKRERKKKDEEHAQAQELIDWDLRKKKAEAKFKEYQAEKAMLAVRKSYGEMVPTEFVQSMFTTFSTTIFSVFDNSLMNLAALFCDELAGGDREALTRINQKLNEELQEIINNAAEIAKKDMKNKIKEFSVTKSRGEREL